MRLSSLASGQVIALACLVFGACARTGRAGEVSADEPAVGRDGSGDAQSAQPPMNVEDAEPVDQPRGCALPPPVLDCFSAWPLPGGTGDALHVADVDGGGSADLLVTDASGAGSFITIRGGDFGTARDHALSDQDLPRPGFGHLLFADVNDDGRADRLHIAGLELHIAVGDGSGAFSEQAAHALPAAAQWLGGADVDGDGAPELLLAFGSSVTAYRVSVQALSAVGASRSYPSSSSLHDAVASDLDGDGTIDLALLLGDGSSVTVAVFRNTGGQLGEATPLQVDQRGTRITAADVDHDCVSELVLLVEAAEATDAGLLLSVELDDGQASPLIIPNWPGLQAVRALPVVDGPARLVGIDTKGRPLLIDRSTCGPPIEG